MTSREMLSKSAKARVDEQIARYQRYERTRAIQSAKEEQALDAIGDDETGARVRVQEALGVTRQQARAIVRRLTRRGK